jgi:alpha-D-ribose 1-methylphosphonate 5-triphosphate diphosphatase
MRQELLLTNARLVLAEEVVEGTVQVVDGTIEAVEPGVSRAPSAVDLDGDYLMPGIVDIHTDNLERHLRPRPGVDWPNIAALLTHDRQIAASGITTVFDSLCVGVGDEKGGRAEALAKSLAAMEQAQADGLLKAEHFLHLRCEVCSPHVVERFFDFADDPLVKLVSVMDHTLGQRQWSRIDKWEAFAGISLGEAELDARLAEARAAQKLWSDRNRDAIVTAARVKALALASHDDTTLEHVADAAARGIGISEFPTTEEAAREARGRGMWVVMGAPNVVLGGSHSGNVSARRLAAEGLVDGLASDYVPVSLIHACFLFHDELGIPLPRAAATVTVNPARMVDLDDRGEIAPGLRADLIWVKAYRHVPVIRGVWRQGQLVA